MRVLEVLADKAEDEGDAELLDAVEEALGNASLMSEIGDYNL